MARIHMILQGKGGVGKSFAASVLAQFKKNKGHNPVCIDTDPVNPTFAGFKAISVKQLNIMDDNEINSRNFDTLMEWIISSREDVIIDNGASSFIPLSHYLISNEVPALLASTGHELLIHTLITGGQALPDTVNGFVQLVRQFPEQTLFVVWLNPYWGTVKHEGKSFDQMKAYLENKDRIFAIIHIPTLKEETYGFDLNEMLQKRLTFDEAIASPSKNIMTRQRLKIIRDRLFEQLEMGQLS